MHFKKQAEVEKRLYYIPWFLLSDCKVLFPSSCRIPSLDAESFRVLTESTKNVHLKGYGTECEYFFLISNFQMGQSMHVVEVQSILLINNNYFVRDFFLKLCHLLSATIILSRQVSPYSIRFNCFWCKYLGEYITPLLNENHYWNPHKIPFRTGGEMP
jgi:hypothetical protein